MSENFEHGEINLKFSNDDLDKLDKSNLLVIEKKNLSEIIPIHTEHPKTFQEFELSGNDILPKVGDTHRI